MSSRRIVESILEHESAHPDGLNGFLLLHLGTGPDRTDKMHPHVAPLLDELTGRGCVFVRVDEMLDARSVSEGRARSKPPKAAETCRSR